jgi:hypothetical protein
MSRGFPRALAAVGIALAMVLAPAASAGADEAVPPADAPLSPESGAYFGASIDWATDTAALQAERLALTPAAFEHATSFPVTDADARYLAEFFRQTEAVGALAVVSLQPAGTLADFDEAAAAAVVAALADARRQDDIPFYVRFAPDMNANWVAWGQRPEEYIEAFRTFAAALHEALPAAATVWSPVVGEDYPFAPDAEASDALLDTDGDGRLGPGDDPYGPYYPGERFVDWVGLAAYHDPSGGGHPVNALPAEDAFEQDLSGPGDLDFYGRFAAASDSPLLLETAAMYAPGAAGPSALNIKRAWWQQVLAAVESGDYPLLDTIVWRDSSSTRVAVGEVVIDWSITGTEQMATQFRQDAEVADLVFAPVYTPFGQTQTGSSTIAGARGWLVAGAVLLGAVALTLWGLSRGRGGPRAYAGPPNRDLRIDMLRGVAIVFVVVNHLALTSLLQNGTQEAIGIVSGAELFVLLSGVVLGMVYRPKVVAGGVGEVAIRTGRRAFKLYVTALVVVLIVGAVSLVTFVNALPATTYVDQGTGAAGSAATGRVYELYANFDAILSYPVDPSVVVDLALLRIGPWQINVLGLYVVMLIVSPLILWALARRRWAIVLIVSGAVYVLQQFFLVRLLPSQFEDSFPLLAWQILFVAGIVAGFHRREILAWFSTRVGSVVLGVSVLLAVVLAIFSWNNPYLSSAYDVRLGLVPSNDFTAVYAAAFERTTLDPGRLLNVVVVTIAAYALLSVLWRPISRLCGWFFLPLGQATLYVFVMHVFFVLIIANIPLLREGDVWINTLAYVVVLALLWVMVKTRFLFKVVPR